MKKSNPAYLTLFVIFSLFLSFPSLSSAELNSNEFSDPDKIYEMSQEWKDDSIEYLPDLKNNDIIVSLNQQFLQLAPFIEEFAKKNNVKIYINEGTCGISSGSLNKKQVDIAGFCCPPGKTDRLPGIKFHTIGIHPVSILVHKSNPVDSLTLEQVRNIFKGNIVYWSEVGGPNIPILPVARLHCKKRPGHWRLLLDNEDLFGPTTRTVGAVDDMFAFVRSNESSIGYEVMWMSKKYEDIKAIRLDNMNPENLDYLLTHKYPVYRTLFLTTWTDKNTENPLASKLIDHIHKKMDENGRQIGMIPASELRSAGWKFRDQELVGVPD